MGTRALAAQKVGAVCWCFSNFAGNVKLGPKRERPRSVDAQSLRHMKDDLTTTDFTRQPSSQAPGAPSPCSFRHPGACATAT